jgi:hypothetical protein
MNCSRFRQTRSVRCAVGVAFRIPWSTDISRLGSSVSIVSGYGLDDRAIEVRSPAEAEGFFL